jgi:hypothetical protein
MDLTPTMRDCLRALAWRAAHGHRPLPRTLPGGIRTVRALEERGLASRDEHGGVTFTPKGSLVGESLRRNRPLMES